MFEEMGVAPGAQRAQAALASLGVEQRSERDAIRLHRSDRG
jgi:hypothetical protein